MHHVVAFELAMHKHIEPDFLLPVNGFGGLLRKKAS